MSDTFDEPPSREPVVDLVRGYVTETWLRWFDELARIAGTGVTVGSITGGVTDDLAKFSNPTTLTSAGIAVTASGGLTILDYPGGFYREQIATNQADLAAGGTVTLIAAAASEQWKIIDIWLAGGTDFNPAGNRSVEITDGTTIYATITEAQLKATATTAARWGDTGVPFPSTASQKVQPTVTSQSLFARYTGGTTDYTSGTVTIEVLAQRAA